MSIEYFYNLTPREFQNIEKGYAKKENARMRLSWEQTRSIMYMVYVSIPDKRKKKSIQNFHPFEWDGKNEIKSDNKKEKVSEKDKAEVFKLLNKQ